MRFVSLILNDIKFQFRYGFYFIYAVICILYIFVLGILPASVKNTAAIILIYSDPAAIGIFLMGALILLEKSQRVLNTLAVSPVRIWEYILSKVISMAFIATIISAILAKAGGLERWYLVAVYTGIISSMFTLVGLAIGTKISSLNQFILYTTPFELLLFVPPVFYLFGKGVKYMYLYPANICIGLVANIHTNIILEIIVLIIAIGGLFLWAYKATKKSWKRLGGVKL